MRYDQVATQIDGATAVGAARSAVALQATSRRWLCFLRWLAHAMNPFKRSQARPDEAVRRFIILLLMQAQQDQATEVVIGVASPGGGTPIRYKVDEAWLDVPPFPSHIRPAVVSELARMAKFPAGQIPGKGVLDVSFGEVRLRWIVALTSADGECMLTRVQD